VAVVSAAHVPSRTDVSTPPPRAAVAIVALDYPAAGPALALVERLGDGCRFYKVGSELFTAEGPDLVRELRDRGLDVFLDLKFHDIPNTVARGVRAAAQLGVRLLTVHASGGAAMLRAATGAAAESGVPGACGVLAVTVLTSFDGPSLAASWGRGELDLGAEVERLADEAHGAGAYGVVCSGHEAATLRDRFGDSLALLVPGVRLPGDVANDQARVVTPADAASAGARYVVLGRTVTAAADPVAAMMAAHAQLMV
jgi:orotidine-5'-phosphate decarboxylase